MPQMKFLFTFFFFTTLVFSQNFTQRKKITNSYDDQKVSLLNFRFQESMKQQEKMKNLFLSKNNRLKNKLELPQKFIDSIPIYYTTYNNGTKGSSSTIMATSLYPGGNLNLDVTGKGIVAGVWDGGQVRATHQELSGRVTQGDTPASYSDHSTHVSGTIAGKGVVNAARGIAYEAEILAYDWNSDNAEMIDFAYNGRLVSNHSYGYSITSLPIWLYGAYDDTSVEIDDVTNTYNFYQPVIAAGNDRSTTANTHISAKGGYDLLTGACNSKNGIVVAAVEGIDSYLDASSVLMSSFSNFGPTDDGRIKPDISAKGVGVYSCISSGLNAYAAYQGTSMATPAITGLITLLQQHYSDLNSGEFMKAALVRGLLCHSAREAGANPGPDYEYGWGLADGEAAAKVISNAPTISLLETHTLEEGKQFTKEISITSPQLVGVTICWTDPVGTKTPNNATDKRTSKLINDLDLIITKGNNEFYPWKLDPDNPINGATQDINNVDNIEKVLIDLADPGVYTIRISHKGSLKDGTQDFALIASSTEGFVLSDPSFDFDNNVVIYPNPATNVLNFSTPSGDTLSNVAIYDSLGKEIKISNSVLNNKLDISELSNGLYIAKFYHNGKLMVNKFVKE